MRPLTRLAGVTALAAATLAASAAAFAGPAGAAVTQHRGPGFPGARHAVFVQTDNLAGNQVVAYHRGADGTLSKAGTYSTGGAGGQLSGSVVDHLASQGSLNYDASRALLIAVNAGSNTVSVFSVSGDRHASGALTPIDSVATGQAATCWVAAAGAHLFASNAGTANVSGYSDGPAGTLTLLAATGTDPGTVDASASADGHYLYVQTGGNGIVDEFRVGADGALAGIGRVTVPGAAGGWSAATGTPCCGWPLDMCRAGPWPRRSSRTPGWACCAGSTASRAARRSAPGCFVLWSTGPGRPGRASGAAWPWGTWGPWLTSPGSTSPATGFRPPRHGSSRSTTS
jgi:hypothetical protein